MKYCKYCGGQIQDSAASCPHCGRALMAPPQTESKNKGKELKKLASAASKTALIWLKKPVAWVACGVLLLVIVLISVAGGGKCDFGSCKNKAVSGYDYCYSHKCSVSGCNRSCYSYSNFCYSHYLAYDDDASSDKGNPLLSYQLKISNVDVYSSGSYTIAEGKLTNNSDTTVTFLKIKGAFKNSYGTVVDTDWTYVVGAEGLAPGESSKWRLSVSKDYSISDCDISILDYDY